MKNFIIQEAVAILQTLIVFAGAQIAIYQVKGEVSNVELSVIMTLIIYYGIKSSK